MLFLIDEQEQAKAMNLKHGFDSNNLLFNPDMQLLQSSGKSVLAITIEYLEKAPNANVGTLYLMRSAGASEEEKSQPLYAYFDRLMAEAKQLPNLSKQDESVITHFCDAVFLIHKLDIPTQTPLNQLNYGPNDPNKERRFLGAAIRAMKDAIYKRDTNTCEAHP